MVQDIWIERFKKEALLRNIRQIKPVKVFLFGSRVFGNTTEDSDIDIIIISDTFIGIPFLKIIEIVLKTANFPKHIDCLCYTHKEFIKIRNSSSIVREAMEQVMEVTL